MQWEDGPSCCRTHLRTLHFYSNRELTRLESMCRNRECRRLQSNIRGDKRVVSNDQISQFSRHGNDINVDRGFNMVENVLGTEIRQNLEVQRTALHETSPCSPKRRAFCFAGYKRKATGEEGQWFCHQTTRDSGKNTRQGALNWKTLPPVWLSGLNVYVYLCLDQTSECFIQKKKKKKNKTTLENFSTIQWDWLKFFLSK